MVYFALIFEEYEVVATTKGAVLDFTLALLYLALTMACEVLLSGSGVYSSLDSSIPLYRGVIWSAAILWTLVSTGRLWFYARSRGSMSDLVNSPPALAPFWAKAEKSYKLSKGTRKATAYACLFLFVFLTALPTIFSSLMAIVVLCDPNVVQEYKNCTVWESTESKRIATGTLLIAQAVIPGMLVLAPVCLVFLFVFAVCKVDCCDDD